MLWRRAVLHSAEVKTVAGFSVSWLSFVFNQLGRPVELCRRAWVTVCPAHLWLCERRVSVWLVCEALASISLIPCNVPPPPGGLSRLGGGQSLWYGFGHTRHLFTRMQRVPDW